MYWVIRFNGVKPYHGRYLSEAGVFILDLGQAERFKSEEAAVLHLKTHLSLIINGAHGRLEILNSDEIMAIEIMES